MTNKVQTESQEENKFTQLCVCPGTILNAEGPATQEQIDELIQYFKDEMNTRVKWDCEVKTLPDLDKFGDPVPETGGRNDLFFFAHSDDLAHFAMPRLQMGIRWWEDVLGNDGAYMYTPEFLKEHPKTW